MPYTFDAEATAQFEEYLDTAASLGLYVQYDMRNSFLNLSSVEYQVDYLKNRSNILIWYTGDEPDGADYDLNSTQLAYVKIYETDAYHPVSLVLNCENYFFTDYGLNGADVLMVDPYPIAVNGRWSKPYNTLVNENYGDGGCDNCNGTFYDISTRIESGRNRARLAGGWRTKPIWIVPQSFNDGGQEFWYRVPTGTEGEAVTPILSFNHGGMGQAAWNSQYSSMDLLNVRPLFTACEQELILFPIPQNASSTAALLYGQTRFLIDHYDTRQEIFSNLSYPGINGYDLASWTIHNANGTGKTDVLVMAVNQNYGPTTPERVGSERSRWQITVGRSRRCCLGTSPSYRMDSRSSRCRGRVSRRSSWKCKSQLPLESGTVSRVIPPLTVIPRFPLRSLPSR